MLCKLNILATACLLRDIRYRMYQLMRIFSWGHWIPHHSDRSEQQSKYLSDELDLRTSFNLWSRDKSAEDGEIWGVVKLGLWQETLDTQYRVNWQLPSYGN